MNWSGGAYLQNAGGNQELEFERIRRENEERRKHKLGNEIGAMVKGAGHGLAKGALLAPLTGGLSIPAGLASGALSGGGIMSGAEQKALVANLAQVALSKGMSRYAGMNGQANQMEMDYGRGLTKNELDMIRQQNSFGPRYF